MSKDGACARCRHSVTGYHVGDWCAICTREGGRCAGEPVKLPPRVHTWSQWFPSAQRSAEGAPITEGETK